MRVLLNRLSYKKDPRPIAHDTESERNPAEFRWVPLFAIFTTWRSYYRRWRHLIAENWQKKSWIFFENSQKIPSCCGICVMDLNGSFTADLITDHSTYHSTDLLMDLSTASGDARVSSS